MKSCAEKKIEALEAAIKTLSYQITNLQKFYSKEQVWCWRVQRFKLRKQLEFTKEFSNGFKNRKVTL